MIPPFRRGGACLAAVAAATVAGCLQTGTAPPRGEVAPGEVRFELAGPGGAALVVPVTVNGAGPYSFVLDTGATLTCVDESLVEELALPEPAGTVGIGGTIGGIGRMRLVSIESLEVGNASAEDLRGCAVDLAPMRSAGLDVHGLVGLNFLRAYRVTLDFEAQTLRLESPASVE